MQRAILVPLDGSTLAEGALDEALLLSELPSHPTVILLHVVPLIEGLIGEGEAITVDQQWDVRKIQALRYFE